MSTPDLTRIAMVMFAGGALACAGQNLNTKTPTSNSAVHVEPAQERPLTEETTRISEHVWAIMGWPNIGIVVGDRATLVVDTGLGKKNGSTVAKVARKLAPNNRLFVTSTHFHPEHAAGILGFPTDALLVRNRVQQDEMDRHGEEMIQLFATMKESWKSVLVGEQLRAPDLTFDRELQLDLGGGVTARVMWLGAAHTKGDQVVFVDPDRTLISGDVVQNQVSPFIYGEGGTATSWINVVESVAKLGARHVLPDHSPPGDGALVEQERAFLVELRDRARALEDRHLSIDAAGAELTADFAKRYPDWKIEDLTSFVKAAYQDR